ncbi:hypothetical protein U1Q18_030907 [Sarracenia purpurea var. burkii]
MSNSALSTFRAKEEEIEKKKLEVKEKVQLQLGRIEEETKRLSNIREILKNETHYLKLSLLEASNAEIQAIRSCS